MARQPFLIGASRSPQGARPCHVERIDSAYEVMPYGEVTSVPHGWSWRCNTTRTLVSHHMKMTRVSLCVFVYCASSQLWACLSTTPHEQLFYQPEHDRGITRQLPVAREGLCTYIQYSTGRLWIWGATLLLHMSSHQAICTAISTSFCPNLFLSRSELPNLHVNKAFRIASFGMWDLQPANRNGEECRRIKVRGSLTAGVILVAQSLWKKQMSSLGTKKGLTPFLPTSLSVCAPPLRLIFRQPSGLSTTPHELDRSRKCSSRSLADSRLSHLDVA